MANQRKLAWQRAQRREFQQAHGYSTAAHYATGGLRGDVLARDGHRCVRCGMTASEHMEKWGRPVTVDHIDKDRARNVLDNLQTLCLACHGGKDIAPALTVPLVPQQQQWILALRAAGHTYSSIADATGFSIGAVWKWVQRWNKGARA